MRRLFLFGAMAMLSGFAASAQDAGDPIRKLVLLTQPQAADPQEYQAAQLIAAGMAQARAHVEVRAPAAPAVRPRLVQAPAVGHDDVAHGGPAERSDPDELMYNLFLSSTADKGYDFVGYTTRVRQDRAGPARGNRIRPSARRSSSRRRR